MAGHELPLGQRLALLVDVEVSVHLGDESDQRRHRRVVVVAEVVGNSREAECCGIKARARIGNASVVQPRDVGAGGEERGGIRGANVVDFAEIPAKLERVLAFGPGDIIHKIVYGHVEASAGVKSERIIQSAPVVEGLSLQANVFRAQADKAVAEVVDECRRKHGNVRGHQTTRIISVGEVGG